MRWLQKIFIRNFIFHFIIVKVSLCKNIRIEQANQDDEKWVINFLSMMVMGLPSITGMFKETKLLEPVQDIPVKRISEYDVLYEDMKGVHVIIQTSIISEGQFEKQISQMNYYAVHAYIKRMPSLKKVIYLAFVDDLIFPDKPEYKSTDVVYNSSNYNSYKNNIMDKKDLEKFSFVVIELPKFTKTNLSQLKNNEERLIYGIKYSDEKLTSEADMQKFMQDYIFDTVPAINKLFSPEMEAKNPEMKLFRRAYANSITYIGQLPDEKRKLLNPRIRSIIFAKYLFLAGVPFDSIHKYTGLSNEDINKVHEMLRLDNDK